ncbi:MAG: GNAT family N-acetyltransferase [Proteobacteria bacterium]|nr:GNAT family N-acetyltransferase [Pseudomonadota bacterium]
MEYQIVPIGERHIAGFHAALDIVSKEKKYLAFLEAPPLDSTAAFVRDNIKNDHPQFVVLAGEQVAGWCDIIPSSRPSQAHVGVLGIGLLPAFRGRGIGRQLMTVTINKARDKQMTRIELGVREKNDNAIALYKRLGFAMEGLRRQVMRVDGVYESLYMMALLF